MIDTLKADFYRLFRTPSFYISQSLLIFGVVASVLMIKTGVITPNTPVVWSGAEMVYFFSGMAAFLIYFCMVLFVVVLGNDLRRRLVRNVITSGTPRAQFFFAKYLVFLAVTAVQFIFYYGLAFLTASALYGIGKFQGHFWLAFLGCLLLQYLITQALFAVGLFMLMLSLSNVAAVLTLIFLPIITGYASIFFSKLTWVSYLSFQSGIANAWDMPLKDTMGYSLTAVAFLLIFIGLAYWVFKKKDL